MQEKIPRIRITRRTTAGQLSLLSSLKPACFPPDATLKELVEHFRYSPEVRTIAITGPGLHLTGIVTLKQITDRVLLDFAPEEFIGSVNSLEDAEEYALLNRLSRAATAAEMMLEPVYAFGDETVVEAFHKMHQAGLWGLPVVGDGLEVTGYLDMTELLLVCFHSEQGEAADVPGK